MGLSNTFNENARAAVIETLEREPTLTRAPGRVCCMSASYSGLGTSPRATPATSPSVLEAQSLKNRSKSLGIVGQISLGEVLRLGNQTFLSGFVTQ